MSDEICLPLFHMKRDEDNLQAQVFFPLCQ